MHYAKSLFSSSFTSSRSKYMWYERQYFWSDPITPCCENPYPMSIFPGWLLVSFIVHFLSTHFQLYLDISPRGLPKQTYKEASPIKLQWRIIQETFFSHTGGCCDWPAPLIFSLWKNTLSCHQQQKQRNLRPPTLNKISYNSVYTSRSPSSVPYIHLPVTLTNWCIISWLTSK